MTESRLSLHYQRLARVPWLTVGWVAATALAVLMALYVVAAGQLLGLLAERRPAVAEWLGNRIGMIAQIDRIDGEMRLLTPVIHLRGVRFYVRDLPLQPDTAPALAAPAIDLEIDTLASLLERRPVLKRLRVEGIDLVLIEDESGRFRIRGMPFNVNDPQAEEKLRQALRVLYSQQEILVERSRLAVESARVPVTALENLRLHMHNDGSEHGVSGSAQVLGPSRLSASFVLRFQGEPVRPQDLVADLYVRVLPASLENWLPRRDSGELWIDALSGGGEAWLRLERRQLTAVTGRVQVDSLAASLADGRKLEGLLGLSTRFRWQAQDDGWTLAFGGLTFRRQGAGWPEADGALEVRRDPAGTTRLRAMLSRGDVGMLAGFAEVLPESQAALRERLARLAPEGQLHGLRLTRESTADQPARWHVATGFAGVALRPDGNLPGIGSLSGRLELLPDAGYLELAATQTQLAWPHFFLQPVPVDDLQLRAVWRRDFGGWHLASNRFSLRNADARASGLLSVELPADDSSPRLQLLGMIEEGRPRAAVRYLPRTASDNLRQWLGSALTGDGRLRRGSFLFHGPLRREPALLRERTFQMRFQGDGLTLAFLAGWPALRGADADVYVANGHVEAQGRQGRLLDSVVRDMRVRITPPSTLPAPDPAAKPLPSRLDVTAQVDGDVANVFALFRDTPLKDVVPAELLRWDGNGRLGATVEVNSLLGAPGNPPHVRVAGTMAGATLHSVAHALEITDASGELRYDTDDGFFADRLRGRALDSEFAGSARTTGGGGRPQTTAIDLRGTLRMAPVSGWLKLPALALLSGEAEAALQLRFTRGADSLLDVRSDLRGIAASAPMPLGKPAASAVDTRLTYTLGTDTPRLTMVYGRQFAADLQIRNGTPHAGAVALGSTRLPQPGTSGLAIEGSVSELDLAEWLAFSRRLAGLPPAPAQTPFTVSRAVAGIVALGDTVQRINVAAARVDAGVFPLADARLQMGREGEGWQVRVDSRTLDGRLVLPDGYQERGDKPLLVQIDRLALPAATGGRSRFVEPLPTVVPRLTLTMDQLDIGGENYGSWSLEAFPENNGVRLRDVHGRWRALDIRGDAWWSVPEDGKARTQFTGQATATDLARVSEAFGFAPNLSSADAKVAFDLGWPGGPWSIDPLQARGTLALDVRDGRFVTASAKSQALRALGVFNISTWQRRLKLDFTDLYKKGVAFDTFTGDVALDSGRLSTTNLVVKGPSALFEVSGSTDLSSKAIDSRLRVTLPVNSNLYVGCLAGLPACAGIVVVEQLWGERLEKMTTLAYEVSGVWDDPKIQQVEGGSGGKPAAPGG
ncbi:MAG: YhdP family protein [Pseudomonadota bacterium]